MTYIYIPHILACQAPLRECQLKFTGHCIRMPTDEPANRLVIYESKIRSYLLPGAPRKTYINQISSRSLPGKKSVEDNELSKDGGEQI